MGTVYNKDPPLDVDRPLHVFGSGDATTDSAVIS